MTRPPLQALFETWQHANHPCYTASPRQGFEAGYVAGAADMKERAILAVNGHKSSVVHSDYRRIIQAEIRALPTTPEPSKEKSNG